MEVKVADKLIKTVLGEDVWAADETDAIDLFTAYRAEIKKKKKRKKNRIAKTYEYQNSMLYAIQALTGEQTHEILTKLVEEADKHIASSNINLKAPVDEELNRGRGFCGYERRIHKYMFYPRTKLYMGLYVSYQQASYPIDRSKFDGVLKYNFKLPSSSLKLDQKEFDEYITDGILCDSSKDVDKPIMRGTMTEEEREVKVLQAKKLKEEKAARKRMAKKKK